jgi:hypothetical protein
VDETNPTGSITRTVIHLKAEHALIVVDELMAKSGREAAFEQFWQIASGLSPAPSDGPQYRFDIAGKGGLTAAFDAPAKTTIEPRGEGSCIRRELRMAKGLAASVFRWTAEPAPVTIKSGRQADGWSVDVSGAGFAGQIVLAAGELRYTPRAV